MASLPIYWNRCEGDVWGELYAVNLNDPHFDNLEGVYMVWLGGSKPAAICAGSGLIREKLAERRAAPELLALREQSLLVTWAKVDSIGRKGVERWMLEHLKPKVPSRIPDALPIEVNLPGRPGQAAPDAGEGPNQRFQDLSSFDAPPPPPPSPRSAGLAIAAAPPPPPPPPPKAAAPIAELARPSLQGEFAELTKKAKGEKLASDAVQLILREAMYLGASDVHLEPQERSLRVRFRLDGLLEEMLHIPGLLNLRVVSHVRVMCGLETEREAGESKPEDARASVALDGVETDLRLSTFPTAYGDTAVLRLIPREAGVMGLDDLGLEPRTADALRALISRPQGLILAAGPAGCGKTTTLYALLQRINTPGRNIVTLEDPIEKKIPGVNQGQISPKAGFGFAEGLRAILRQDPNVIMLGDVHDRETAENAVAAALTGRLVFLPLLAAAALGAIARLIDMGLDPHLVASALTAVSAQRLARKLCPDCVKSYEPTPAEAAEVESRVKNGGCHPPAGWMKSLKRGAGCPSCRQSGYRGRVLLFEFVPITPALRELILKKAPLDELRAASLADGGVPLFSDGLRKAAEGLTSLSEVLRVVDSAA